MNVLFVQFANSMFPRFGVSDGYWDAFYSEYRDFGYVRMEDAFEVPKWVAEVCHFLPKGSEARLCMVRHSIDEAVEAIGNGKFDWVLFSVMTCTKGFTDGIIKRVSRSQRFVIGGYDDWIHVAGRTYPNVSVALDMGETAKIMGLEYHLGTDYSLFKDWSVLPRLTLSTGCMNNCRFCTIPHVMETMPDEVVLQQIDSFKDLDFKLIYLDDKTFGQAKNYRMIGDLSEKIRKYNGSFSGFVVQTTSGMLAQRAREFKEIGVVVAEIGLETYNNSILKSYRKPSSEALVDKAVDAGLAEGIHVIPNVIVGFPEETEETYMRTKSYLESRLHDIIGVNFSMYTDYSAKDCNGEVDFALSDKVDLHRKYWRVLNELALKCLDKGKWV